MRGIAVATLTLALAAGCSGEADTTVTPTTSAAPERGAWAVAREKIAALSSARYTATLVTQRCSKAVTSSCTLTDQTIRSTGVFGLNPTVLNSELTVDRAPGEKSPSGAVQVRALPNGGLYSRDTSRSNACWIRWEPTYAPAFELAFRTGLAVLKATQVDYDVPVTRRTGGTPATANALAVIRTLGLPESLDATYGITTPIKKALRRRTVSIELTFGVDGSPVTFTVNGRQVASELASDRTAEAGRYLDAVRNARSAFTLSDFGVAAAISEPPPDQVVPRAVANPTC